MDHRCFLANNCYILVSELSAVLIVQVGKQLVMLVNVLMQVLVLVAVASHLCANCNRTVPNFLVGCRILAECKPAKYFSGSCGGGEHYLRWMWHCGAEVHGWIQLGWTTGWRLIMTFVMMIMMMTMMMILSLNH